MKKKIFNAVTPKNLKRLISSLILQGKLSDLGVWLGAQLHVVEYWTDHQSGGVSPDEDSKLVTPHQTIPQQWEMSKAE